MRKREDGRTSNEGIIAIEALIGIFVFMVFMFAMYSYIVLFMANNMIEHALMQASESMALESYELSKLKPDEWSLSSVITSTVYSREKSTESEGEGFTDPSRWYESNEAATKTAKDRFAAYLGGNRQHAEELLKIVGVQGGIEGMNIEATISEGDLTISTSYDIYLLYRMSFGNYEFGKYKFQQSAVSKMWNQ